MRPRTFTTTWVLPLKAARFDVRDLDARMIESTSIFIGPHYFDKVIVYNIEKKNSYYLSHAKYVRK
jgi:hypothetical protein